MNYLRVGIFREVFLVQTDPIGGDAESRREGESVFPSDDALVLADRVFAGLVAAVALVHFVPLFTFAAFPSGEVAKGGEWINGR